MEIDSIVVLHAQIIKKNGKKEYAILPYEEFLKVQEALDEFQGLRCLREAKGRKSSEQGVQEIENYFFILGTGNQGKIGEFMNSWTDPHLLPLNSQGLIKFSIYSHGKKLNYV